MIITTPKGDSMDTLEFEKLISSLDHQIDGLEDARKARESTENRIKLVSHWKAEIELRVECLTGLGTAVPIDVMETLVKLQKEEKQLTEKLDSLPEVPEPRATDFNKSLAPEQPEPGDDDFFELPEEEKQDILRLCGEIQETNLLQMTDRERWLLFPVWALRWRTATETVGQERAPEDPDFRRGFAMIRERMNHYRTDMSPFIPALNPRRDSNWKQDLARAVLNLSSYRKSLQDGEVRRRECEDHLNQLKMILSDHNAISTEEIEKQVRHHIRMAVRDENLRPQIAAVCRSNRNLLEEEFKFLWVEKVEEVTEKKEHLTRRVIVERILRKMISNAAIGGSHIPMDKSHKGFPSHEQFRAKEAVDRLIRADIMKCKSSGVGDRLSIEPTVVIQVRQFLDGGTLCAPIDDWIEEE